MIRAVGWGTGAYMGCLAFGVSFIAGLIITVVTCVVGALNA